MTELNLSSEEANALMDDLIIDIRKMNLDKKALDAKIKAAKAKLTEIANDQKIDGYTSHAGTATLITPNPRVVYDKQALDALYKSSDEAQRLLAPHRTLKQGNPFWQVK